MSMVDGPERFELVPEARVRRGTATINVSYADKEVFDAIQWWITYRLGRPANPWDVFSFLLGEALGNKESPLAKAVLFPT